MFDYLPFTPNFQPFQGPLRVASTILEVPVDEICNPSSPHSKVSTVKARIFYPTSQDADSSSNPVWWLQEPQGKWISAYGRFLGASSRMAKVFSYVPSFVQRTRIPATADGPLLTSQSSDGKWPVAIFSHGLGGSCNAYSYLCGTLASCGMVVFAIEHRDGSAPISVVNERDGTIDDIDYTRFSHTPTPDVLNARNNQLRIRMTELDILFSLVTEMNAGKTHTNVNPYISQKKPSVPPSFASKLELDPARVSWMGHSFGAATMVQLVKSVYWSRSIVTSNKRYVDLEDPLALYTPATNEALNEQITPKSPMVLLDLWTMPLRSEKSQWLFDKPLPCFDDEHRTTSTVLSVMSDEFHKWTELRERTKYVLSGKPGSTGVATKNRAGAGTEGPRLFRAYGSAHASQSDFGLLFPWTIKRLMGAAEPDRIMNLNVRAILQLLRENAISILPIKFSLGDEKTADAESEKSGDDSILANNAEVRNWTAIPLDIALEA